MSRLPDRMRRHHQRAHTFTDRRKEADRLAARETVDPFEDDEPLVCGLEDPESCESCQ